MLDVKFTYHAIEEAKKELIKEYGVEHFGDMTTYEYSVNFIKESMKQATFISEIMSESGKIDRLFAFRRFCFVLDRVDDVVITVYKRDNVHEEIRSLVKELLFEKLADLQQTEKALEEERLAADMRFQLEKHINKALSNTSFSSTFEELAAWDELKTIDKKLYAFRLKKSKLAKGIAAYL